MKGAGKIILGVSFVSFLMLVYVHEQISLFHISYELDAKQNKLMHLSEEYRKVKFEVDQLRAPRLLETKLKQLSFNLALPQEVRVVRVPVPEKILLPVEKLQTDPSQDHFFNFLGRWVDVAQAKEDAKAED